MRTRSALALTYALLAGCMSPAGRLDQQAATDGLVREVLAGATFRHITYARADARGGHSELHVYLEHDGTPWLRSSQVAADPTPRQPLMLDLMRLDGSAVLYLGRPCYLGLESDPTCHPLVWTHRRYAPEVVDSMAAALRRFLATHSYDRLVLFGHSGGGTLAVLLAERFPTTVAIVTLGANLDIDRWAELHDYSQLRGSLNPIQRPPLPLTIVQWHYVGTLDQNVPPGLVSAYVRSHPGGKLIEVAGFDHACCWRDLWPEILTELRERLSAN